MGQLREALEAQHRDIDAGIAQPGLARAAALEALRRHIYLEEALLFPPLRKGPLMASIFVMVREHGALWGAMAALEAASGDAAKAEAASTALLALLAAHNGKEEPTIYARMDDDLAAEVKAGISGFIAGGAMPDGWACAKAPSGA